MYQRIRIMTQIGLRAALNERTTTQLAELFRAFSDANRVRLIAALLDGERSVMDLADEVGLSESATSHHMRGLRLLQLVRTRKEGRQVFYRLDDDHVATLFKQGLNHVQHG